MNITKRLITLLLLACGMTTGLWASSIPGALTGRFTINASGDKIVFSQGNLQYVGTWQFAEHQWDCFSASQYNDHRDLFGWGTGDAPNKVSTNNGDYGTFTDWGTNAITNGGNKANVWRTLTKDEWVYLFYSRENAATLFGFGSVNGVNGLIILPDNWTTPEGASFTASTTLGLTNQGTYYHNDNNNNYSHNTYTAEQWAVMESSGAVFLPAAAYRHGADSNIHYTELGGFYWSSTPYSADKSYYLNFYSNDLDPQFNEMRYGGRPVRLVKASLDQDNEGYYLLGSLQDWRDFATLVQSTPTANARMTADINIDNDQTMIGTATIPYQGIFDGQGHTLTVNFNMRDDITGVAPFTCVGDATIQNLHVDGSIIQQNMGAGGIVAAITGNLTIKKCWVSADVKALIGTTAGIACYCDNAAVQGKTILLEDCMFSGYIGQGSYSGGLMSHVHGSDGYNNSASFVNCLNLGICASPSGSTGTFARTGVQGDPYTITNCYYKTAWQYAQGTQATTEQLTNGTTAAALQNNRAETVWVQDPLTNQPMLALFTGPVRKKGDVDGNGEVNSADVVAIYNYILSGEAETGITKEAADVDGNGDVNSADVVAVYNIIIGE